LKPGIFRRVSIHAPAKGATSVREPVSKGRTCFNPRAREGRDNTLRLQAQASKSFNPRAREGRDCCSITGSTSGFCFNPRAREGRDLD